MKKISVLILMLMGFAYSCQSNENVKKDVEKKEEVKQQNEITVEKKEEKKEEVKEEPKEITLKLSENLNFIIQKTFVYDFVLGNVDLTLRNDNSYESELGSAMKYWYNEGTYSVENDKIILQPTICMDYREGEKVDCSMTLGKSECYVVQKNDSIYYEKYIQCKSFENNDLLGNGNTAIDFPVSDFIIKEGTEKLYDGKKIIIDNKKGIINKDSFIYTSINLNNNNSEEGNPVFKDEEVEVVAHTKDKYKFNGSENYWYLISKNMFREIWIFGDSLTIGDKIEKKYEFKEKETRIDLDYFDESAYQYSAETEKGKLYLFLIALKGNARGGYYYENEMIKRNISGTVSKREYNLSEKEETGGEIVNFYLYQTKEKEGLSATITNTKTGKVTKVIFKGGSIWPAKYENIYGYETTLTEKEVGTFAIELKKQILDKNKEWISKQVKYPLSVNS